MATNNPNVFKCPSCNDFKAPSEKEVREHCLSDDCAALEYYTQIASVSRTYRRMQPTSKGLDDDLQEEFRKIDMVEVERLAELVSSILFCKRIFNSLSH